MTPVETFEHEILGRSFGEALSAFAGGLLTMYAERPVTMISLTVALIAGTVLTEALLEGTRSRTRIGLCTALTVLAIAAMLAGCGAER